MDRDIPDGYAARIRQARMAEDPAQALELAVALWRQCRAPEVADVIDRLDVESRHAWKIHTGRERDRFHEVWLEVARTRPEALATGWLVRTLFHRMPNRRGPVEQSPLVERLNALKTRAPDPRLGSLYLRLILEKAIPTWGPATRVVYGGLLDALIEVGDVRQATAIEALIGNSRQGYTDFTFVNALLPTVAARLAATPWSSPPDSEQWANLFVHQAEAGLSEEEMLSAIYRDPEDDGWRQVYADWLIERKDPRGEFIALQFSHRDDKRERVLWRTHGKDWLGPDLSQVLCHVVFERGFLASASLEQNAVASPEIWERATLDERLRTLHTLRKGRGNAQHYGAFLASPVTTGLRRVQLPTSALCELLLSVEEGLRRLHHLELAFVPRRDLLQRMAEASCLRELSSLTLTLKLSQLQRALQGLSGTPLPKQLDTILLQPTDDWQAQLDLGACWRKLPHQIVHLGLQTRVGTMRLQRLDDGLLLCCPKPTEPSNHLAEVVSVSVPRLALRFVEDLKASGPITVRGLTEGEGAWLLAQAQERGLSVELG